MTMKAYVWKDRLGLEYIVFSTSEKKAKDFLRLHYDGKDLDRLLFNSPVFIRKMPVGLCSMDPARTVWFDDAGEINKYKKINKYKRRKK